jgi:peptide/nickel transport system substrate-binding protein
VCPAHSWGRAFGIAFFLVASAALISGCGGDRPQPVATATGPTQLRLGTALPQTGLTSLTNSLIVEPLIGLGWDGRPSGRVVSDFSWSADRLTLTLRLRPGLKFHDGSPVNIENFEHTLKTATKEVSGAVSFGSIKSIARDPESKDSLLVSLTRPEAFLVTDLANSSLRHPTNSQVGTGPFRLESADARFVNFKAFGDYYQGPPSVSEIKIENFTEHRGAWAAFLRGELDALHEIAPTVFEIAEAEGQTTLRPYAFLRPYFLQLVFNIKNPKLKNPSVRQALNYGVDRQEIVV